MKPNTEDMGTRQPGRRRGRVKVTHTSFKNPRGRIADLRGSLVQRASLAVNSSIPCPQSQTVGAGVFEEPASLLSTIHDSAGRYEVAQARDWKKLEHWASRAMWTVVTITLVVDLVATFGYRSL